jgi:NADH:ubiquinone oxidoreductase, Na(+)-translocating, A subunit
MANEIKIRKGFTIRLVGQAEKVFKRLPLAGEYSLYPDDFPLLALGLLVREGDAVLAGSPLLCDKRDPRVRFCSPVNGRVARIERGERRHIDRVVVECDAKDNLEYKDFGAALPSTLSRDDIIAKMLQAGVWPMVRQRPFNIVASPDVRPRAVFISAFDTAPLAPDLDFAIKDDGESFQVGIDVLRMLTDGGVHLGVNAKYPPNIAFEEARGVTLHRFSGIHPVGNVGIQIHHVAPVAKGEVVWTLHPLDVVVIGRLFSTGHYDARRIVAVTGSRVAKPRYYLSMVGMPMRTLLEGQLQDPEEKLRIISGNVLTGTKVGLNDGLRFYHHQVTVIPEGNHYEFMGWAMPGFRKLSASRLFTAFLCPHREYDLDTNLHGGRRAFVVNGQYERVFPMRIYPVQLIKAILAGAIEEMEDLGIYEVAEEDFALCDFVCTSKIEAQSIVREGLNRMVKELS